MYTAFSELRTGRLVQHVLAKRVVLPSAIISLAGKIAKCKVEIPGVQIMTVNNQSARIYNA